jgi:MFS family permease
MPIGQLVSRIGERGALIAGGLVSILSIIGCLVAAAQNPVPGWAPVLFFTAMLTMSLGDLTWGLGRQVYVAEAAPALLRARAMSMFGGTARAGRVLGPLLGAGAIAIGGTGATYVVHLVCAVLAMSLILRFVPHSLAARGSTTPPQDEPPVPRRTVLRPLLLVSVAVLILMAVRTNRDLLLPLLGNHFGYRESTIALIFSMAAAFELALIFPGGMLTDRFGRTIVLVPCLVLMGTGFLMANLAASFGGFVLIAAVCALGNGLGSGIVMTLSADLTPQHHRARWIGLWNSIANAGSLAGPGLVAAVTSIGGVVAATVASGWLALIGAGWAIWWVPRLLPGPRKHAG